MTTDPITALRKAREALDRIERAPAWGYPEKWETTPGKVRQLARAAIAEIDAALAQPMPAVKVRPLEWRGPSRQVYKANVLGGVIRIIDWLNDGPARFALYSGTIPRREFDTLDKAKAAAQDDYEREILSALELPAGVVDRVHAVFGNDASIVKTIIAMAGNLPTFSDGPYRDGFRAAIEEIGARADLAVGDGGSQLQDIAEQICRLVTGEAVLLDAPAAPEAAPPSDDDWQPTHRHVKSGGEYRRVGIGRMQANGWQEFDDKGRRYFVDMRDVAIYVGRDGALWVRPLEEFEDGRFEEIPAPPAKGGEDA